MNQYTWQTTVHEGKMYLSTMNTTTLLEPIAQFTNGDILNMNEKDWNNTVHYLRVFLRLLWGMGPTDPASAIATQSNDQNAKVTTQTMPSTDNPEALVDWARIRPARTPPPQPQTTDAKSVLVRQADQPDRRPDQELVDGIKDGSIVPGSLAASGSSDEASQLFDINNELDNLGSQLSDKGSADFANNYGEVTDAFFSIADIIPRQVQRACTRCWSKLTKQGQPQRPTPSPCRTWPSPSAASTCSRSPTVPPRMRA